MMKMGIVVDYNPSFQRWYVSKKWYSISDEIKIDLAQVMWNIHVACHKHGDVIGSWIEIYDDESMEVIGFKAGEGKPKIFK